MRFPRASGILLHPTSLPGRFGIGDLGEAAHAFVDFLVGAKQSLWQVLPLGPTGYGDSPYQCFSSFAGNPLLISPEALARDGLLDAEELRALPPLPEEHVDFGAVITAKSALFECAARRFFADGGGPLAEEFAAFRRDHATWLPDFALFMALKEEHGGVAWNVWPPELARREPRALGAARVRLAENVRGHEFLQFAFFRQWLALKQAANRRGIRMIGDIPIFAAYDSADVWSRRELFFLDDEGLPTVVAGVPPDLFSATGQLWGNPLYRWQVMARDGYAWWVDRVRATLELVDILRIDHFIGFTRYWEVPASETTAVKGRWLPGPGVAFGQALADALGELPIIAEDLGDVTPEVSAMRDRFDLPGMKVLQFGFGGDASSPFLPHHYSANFVAYTGTHDNDTSVGWFASASPRERSFVQRYLARSGEDIAYDFIRAAMSSVADTVIIPLQDVLALDSSARMNVPGQPAGNWSWRLRAGALNDWHRVRLREMTELYDRAPREPEIEAESGAAPPGESTCEPPDRPQADGDDP